MTSDAPQGAGAAAAAEVTHDFWTEGFPADYTNARNIPKTNFIENVPEFFKQSTTDVDAIFREMQEQYEVYKQLSARLKRRKDTLKAKVPEILHAIEMIDVLEARKDSEEPLTAWLSVGDPFYAQASIANPKTVGLWLGADVMVEYTFADARKLLRDNLATARKSLSDALEDLAWVRDQMTIMEVNISRVYNHEVARQRREKTAAETAAR
eukprot:TRINITY_DN3533_c0_g1_i1.p1 TRINITY_DN3533_c0_g1~~TRINITY_DN3533_c0_g1_i1.p1  ORF type:complete len:220 (+),score=40.73 TRINITY_DN3533_c0_g1_i1:33-662(+)